MKGNRHYRKKPIIEEYNPNETSRSTSPRNATEKRRAFDARMPWPASYFEAGSTYRSSLCLFAEAEIGRGRRISSGELPV